jgi:hypothetical protein
LVEAWGKLVSNYLSRNEMKHFYKETEEEKLMVTLKVLLRARDEGEEQFVKEMKVMRDAATKSSSKHSGMFNNKLVTTFYLMILQYGSVFHNGQIVQIKWVLDTFRGQYGGVSTMNYQNIE